MHTKIELIRWLICCKVKKTPADAMMGHASCNHDLDMVRMKQEHGGK
jgi:hypothetical protein